MRFPLSATCLSLTLLPSTLAVFADEAYVTDYHHQLLGIPQPQTTFFHRPRKEDKGTLLYTLSDLGVLGAVRPANGQVVWRQLITEPNSTLLDGFLRPIEGENTVVSGIGRHVDAWDAASGRQKWTAHTEGDIRDLEIVETVPGGAEIKDILVLTELGGKGVLKRLKGDTGGIVWQFKDISNDIPLQTSTNLEHIFTVSLHGSPGAYTIKVIVLDPVHGRKITEYNLAAKSDVFEAKDVLLVGANSASPIVAWTDRAKKVLKINILGKNTILQSLPLPNVDGDITRVELHAPHLIQSLPHFLVQSFSANANRADVYHIDIATSTIKKAYELPKLPGSGTISTSSQEANVFFTRVTEDEVITVSSSSHAVLGRWPLKLAARRLSLTHGVSEVVSRSPDSYAVRSAVITKDEDWLLVQNGIEAWVRHEGLSGGVSAAWAEIPESETLAKALEDEAHRTPLSAYIHRVQRHVVELQHLPSYLQALPNRLLASIIASDQSSQKTNDLTRDTFGFNKIVVLATQRGRVYGLDAGNRGSVVWNVKAYEIPHGSKWDVKGIWVENARSLATLRGHDGEYIIVQTHTGKVVEKTPPGSWPLVESTAVIDSAKGKWLLTIGVDGAPGDIPKDWVPNGVLVVKGLNGELRGLKYVVEGVQAKPVIAWIFHPGPGQEVVNIVSKPPHDPVASIGRVLGDRSVLYKYLNPNVVLVTAVAEKASQATIYLIDTISGDILHSESHEGVDTAQPISSILTENWFAYSFFSDSIASPLEPSTSKGYQIVVSDLYESEIPNHRGPLGSANNASSLEPTDVANADPSLPHVVSQSFFISQPIDNMAVTQTRQGITTRQLLCTIAEQNSIVGIPRTTLEPRRPVGREATALELEEGLYKYAPVIELDPKLVITHKREVASIKTIITTPALLESTSLVFAYGVDVFGTRVSPSEAFDVLGKGFNRLSLISTVLALGLGVGVLAPLVRRKQINALRLS